MRDNQYMQDVILNKLLEDRGEVYCKGNPKISGCC